MPRGDFLHGDAHSNAVFLQLAFCKMRPSVSTRTRTAPKIPEVFYRVACCRGGELHLRGPDARVSSYRSDSCHPMAGWAKSLTVVSMLQTAVVVAIVA